MRANEAVGSAADQPLRDLPSRQAPELRMAKVASAVIVGLSLPVIGIAALSAGRGGALGAAIAAALVLAMFGLSGASVAFAARFGPSAVMAAALGGFMLRLVAYALLIVLLRPVEAIHGPSLAISAAVLLIATLVCEAWLVITRPGFFWVDTSARPAGHIERKMV